MGTKNQGLQVRFASSNIAANLNLITRFQSEADLRSHLSEHSDYLNNLHKNAQIGEVYQSFAPIRIRDRGVYFCMSYEDSLFKIVHIKVNELSCNNRFKCLHDNFCINLHYVCDGKPDCFDGSDEDYDNCEENPCEGKILCEITWKCLK